MEIEKIRNHLDKYSKERLRQARGDIDNTFRIEKDIKDICYKNEKNFWEWVVKEWQIREKDIKRFLAFYFLIQEIKDNGVKTPIFVRKKSDGFWELRNGHHRFAIAESLNIKELNIEFDKRQD